uniref:GDP-fucose protein O-fucosyltransferase 2 n=1 Tax=Parastrongyloides trichosuri TaxID=131310 RepID=A0A0N4ZUE2_PARTI
MLVKHLEQRRQQYFTYNENYDVLNSLQYIVSSWNCDQFAEWLKGVDDGIIAYIPKIKKANITGKNLNVIDEEYLENIGIYSFGIRRIIMQAIDSLLYFCRDIEKDNLQRLMLLCVSKLDMLITCVQKVQTTPEQIKNSSKDNLRLNVYTFLNNTYSNLANVVDEVKKIIFWLDRSPFDRLEQYIKIREKILNDCIDLANVISLRSRNILKTNSIFTKAKQMKEYLLELIKNRNDPIFVCTSFTERAVVKIKEPMEWGINIQSSFRGVHVISEIRANSPADKCEKLDAGDEILQINGITVIGWELQKVAKMLIYLESTKENNIDKIGKQIVLLVNKRPRNPIAVKPFIRPHKPKERTSKENKLKTLTDFNVIFSNNNKQVSPIVEDPSATSWLKLSRTSSLNIAKSAWKNHNQRYAGSTIQFASIAHISLEEEPKKIKRRNSISGDKPDNTEYEDVPFEIEIDNEIMRRNSFVNSYLKSRGKRAVFRQFSNDTIILEQDDSVTSTTPDVPNIIIRRTRRMRQQPDGHVKSFINNRLTEEVVETNVREETNENDGDSIAANLNYAQIELIPNEIVGDLKIDKIPNITDTDWSAPINEITKLNFFVTNRKKDTNLTSTESPKVNSNFYFESSPSNSATPLSNNFPLSPPYSNRYPLSPFSTNNRNKCFTPASTVFTDISDELPSSRQSTSSTYNILKTTSPSSSTSSHYSLSSIIHRTKPIVNTLAPLAEPDDVDTSNKIVQNEASKKVCSPTLDKKPSLEDIIEITEIPYANLSGILIEGWIKYLYYGNCSSSAIQKSQSGNDMSTFLNNGRWKTSAKYRFLKAWAVLASINGVRYLLIYSNQKSEKADILIQPRYFQISLDTKLKASKKHLLLLSNKGFEIYLATYTKEDTLFWNDHLIRDNTKFSIAETNYLLYDVNYGEGFNLRRDVYLRIANTIRHLRENGKNYILVLPPFGRLYHWKKGENKMPWRDFFDIDSLKKFIPVIDFDEFLDIEGGNIKIDLVLYLQSYKEGWGNHFEIKYDERECIDNTNYKNKNNEWYGWFYGYHDNVIGKDFHCLSIQGQSKTLADAILKLYNDRRIIFVDRTETILHDHFSDVYYWKARRSMRYSKNLIEIGNLFRKNFLHSTDESDKTLMNSDWTKVTKKHGNALGGNYICIHWRRGDFIRSHSKDIPSIKGTAIQLKKFTEKYNTKNVFLSSDCNDTEFDELKKEINKSLELYRFINATLSDGGVSIVDQYICSHAKAFIGSYVSTFSFRIHEDREIMGFLSETTFNRLCPDNENECEQPTMWKIQY